MAPHKFLLSGKAAVIALLLFAAAPPVLAQVSPPAADSLLQQLQAQKIEAEARAAEAEKREREAEINRLTEQARQEKFRADAEAQRNLAAQSELFIQQAKTELHNSAYSRLEIIAGVSIGFFGVLITAIVVFFALRTEKTAVAAAVPEAIAAAKARVEDIRGKLEARLVEAEALLEKIRKHETDAEKIVKALRPGEVVNTPEDRKTIADAARVALARSPRDRSANEFRTLIIHLQIREAWTDMLEAAQQMRLLYGGRMRTLYLRVSMRALRSTN